MGSFLIIVRQFPDEPQNSISNNYVSDLPFYVTIGKFEKHLRTSNITYLYNISYISSCELTRDTMLNR